MEYFGVYTYDESHTTIPLVVVYYLPKGRKVFTLYNKYSKIKLFAFLKISLLLDTWIFVFLFFLLWLYAHGHVSFTFPLALEFVNFYHSFAMIVASAKHLSNHGTWSYMFNQTCYSVRWFDIYSYIFSAIRYGLWFVDCTVCTVYRLHTTWNEINFMAIIEYWMEATIPEKYTKYHPWCLMQNVHIANILNDGQYYIFGIFCGGVEGRGEERGVSIHIGLTVHHNS